MAIQDIRRAQPDLPLLIYDIREEPIGTNFDQLRTAYKRLAMEVIEVHNRLEQFSAAIANGLTTINVTLPIPMPDASYWVGAEFSFNNGGYWTSAKTTAGFTLTWATASVGAQSVRIAIIG